jgi:hypothetical protein
MELKDEEHGDASARFFDSAAPSTPLRCAQGDKEMILHSEGCAQNEKGNILH